MCLRQTYNIFKNNDNSVDMPSEYSQLMGETHTALTEVPHRDIYTQNFEITEEAVTDFA